MLQFYLHHPGPYEGKSSNKDDHGQIYSLMDEEENQETIRRKQRAHRKARKTDKKQDRDKYRLLQQAAQFNIRVKNEYMHSVSNNFKENPKKFWSFLKSRGQVASWVAMLKNKNGYLKSDKTSKAEILNDQFQSVSPEKILPAYLTKVQIPINQW